MNINGVLYTGAHECEELIIYLSIFTIKIND